MDRLYYNGNIYSIDDKNNKYSALGIDKGKIVFLGNKEDIDFENFDERIDLQGKSVFPGFVDSHLHMLNYAFVKQSYGMQKVYSIAQMMEEGKRLVEDVEGDNWLYGRGWNEQSFTDEKRFITRHDLDKISEDVPILFIRACGHAAAVNTKALNIVLSLEETKQFIDQINAEDGILTEASVKLCYNVMKKPDVKQIKEMILLAQSELNKAGITGVETDNFLSLPGRDSERIMTAYRELEEEGKLTLRVREQASFTTYEDMKKFIDDGNRTGDGGEYYSIGPVKLYEDGSLGAKTALMNNYYQGTSDYGVAVHEQDDLDQFVDYAYKHDMQIIVHAIGDRASDMVMNSYEKSIEKYGQKNLRLAVNHMQVISDDLIERMKKSDVIGYIQPVFVASDKGGIRGLVGDEPVERSYLWKTMIDNGIVCCGGSDSPVEDFDILANIQIAVTRDCLDEKTEGWYPEQKLTVEEAIRLFTWNNAYGAFEEDRRGSIEIGKDADLTILDKSLFDQDPHDIVNTKVMETVVAGKTVYKAV